MKNESELEIGALDGSLHPKHIAPRDAVDVYQATLGRIEPNFGVIDRDATLTSIAISLKRIADVLSDTGEEKGKTK